MSVNIMDLVKGAVSNQVMGQIGGLLGTDAKKTPSLFETAAGSILGGLMKKGSSSAGAQDIFGAVQKQDDGILDKLGDLLGGGDHADAYQKQGSGILDLITGGGQQSTGMIGTVAKALGMDSGIVGKLLMMAAPIVMGVIGRHVKNKALDAVGLGNLLGSQGPSLSGFMPSSLTSDLGLGNLVGNVTGAAGSAAGAVGNAAGAAVDGVGNLAGSAVDGVGNVAGSAAGAVGSAGRAAGNVAGDAANAGGGLLKYILPIGLLAVAAMFLGPWIYDQMTKSTGPIDKASISAEGAVGVMPAFDPSAIPGFDALGETGTTLSGAMTGITDGLRNVEDEAGATTLAEKITGFTGSLDGMGLDSLEGPAKTASSGLIGKFIETIKGLIAGKSDGVKGILQPVIDTLMEKLNPLAG